MVGRFYWYSHARAATELGYRPRPAREALAESVAFLVRSPHITAELRRTLALGKEVYDAQIRLRLAPHGGGSVLQRAPARKS